MSKSEQHALEFQMKTRIGEPSSILPMKGSYGAMWVNGDTQLRMIFHPSGLYSLSFRHDKGTTNYKGSMKKPFSETTLKIIKKVSKNNLDLKEAVKYHTATPGNVVACSDFSTSKKGDIVIGIIEGDYISIQKEGLNTIVLSMTSFLRMYNKWMDLQQELNQLKEMI